jgi:hypothetical protein
LAICRTHSFPESGVDQEFTPLAGGKFGELQEPVEAAVALNLWEAMEFVDGRLDLVQLRLIEGPKERMPIRWRGVEEPAELLVDAVARLDRQLLPSGDVIFELLRRESHDW